LLDGVGDGDTTLEWRERDAHGPHPP
jgi:hypothetical protein